MSHLKDPTTQYYTGEYPKQKQPTPGIQAKMTPVPDCGEKSVALPPLLTRVKGLTWRSVIFPWKKKTLRM